MTLAIVLILSLLVATLFGHAIHWALHQRWAGIFRRSHMDHHLLQYPPKDLLSKRYRASKWYHSGVFLFTPALVVILAVTGGLLWCIGAPLWTLGVFGGTLVGFGLLNDYVHDNLHVKPHWLERFKWFRVARELHFYHHRDMKRNFGIFFFGWDRVFGTLKKK